MPVRYALMGLLFLVFAALVAPAQAQTGADWDIPGGHFYTQTAQDRGGGFSVVDDAEARFWSEFQRLGGLQNVGYPISRRFVYDGFVTQAFQKLVLQWRPEVNQAWPINVFDDLSRHGKDDELSNIRQTPYPLQNFDPPGATWDQIVRNRWALLDTNVAIRARYFAAGDPLNVYGLPVSRVEDRGNHYALRTQRAVFQQWKENVPWASRGQVTIANGGDIGKEMGWLSGPYLEPELPPGQPSQTLDVFSMAVASSRPERVYALVRPHGVPYPTSSLRISDDLGRTWRAFPGGVPVCAEAISIESASDTLYASTCEGLQRWTGNVWVAVSPTDQYVVDAAIAPGQQRMWLASGSVGLRHSTNGGATWEIDPEAGNVYGLLLDSVDNQTLYSVSWNRVVAPFLRRRDPSGVWANLPGPEGKAVTEGLVQDWQTGDLYVMTNPIDSVALWRTSNARDVDPADVRWQRVFNWGGQETVQLLAASRTANDVVLFARAQTVPDGTPQLRRSTDGGQSWESLAVP